MINVEFENQNGDWAFRIFNTQQAADVFAKNAEKTHLGKRDDEWSLLLRLIRGCQ
jgi:hypothetical protein